MALRKLQGFDVVVRKLSGVINERMVKMLLLGSAVRVTERQFPVVHRLYVEAATALDVPELPELFVAASPILNASTIGMDAPKIVLNSALVDLLDEDELRFVLGHELGHALSGHALYQTLLTYLVIAGQSLASLPFSGVGLFVVRTALGEWARKAELSGDRAGLLATQDVSVAVRVQMKLASGGHLDQLDQTEFLAQAREYENADDLGDSLMKIFLLDSMTHPMGVVRAAEIRRWVDSGEYAAHLAGGYPRRDEDKDATISAEAAAAADSYASSFQESEDAAAKLLRDLGQGIGNVGRWIGYQFTRECSGTAAPQQPLRGDARSDAP